MSNSIERDVYVLRNTLKNPISYVRGTDLLPIIFHFRDFTIPSGATAKVFVSKNDGNAAYGGATITGNDVTVDVTQQMFITLGVNLMQVEIDSGNETLVTFEQPVMATPNLKAGDLPDSTTDVDFIDKIIEQAQEAVNDANAALETANTAISGANTAAESANSAAQNANNAAEELQDKVDAGDFTASVQVGTTTTLEPGQDATVSNGGTSKDAVFNFGIPKGDPGTAATIQVGTTQTVQPEENAEVTNSGTTTAAVLDFKIPRGKDGMTDLTAEYKDASEYTCQPTVNAPVVVKELGGKTEQGENPSPDNPQAIKGVGGTGYFDGEWIQGYYGKDGVYQNNTSYVSSNKIYCNPRDSIAVKYEKVAASMLIYFFNESGGFISLLSPPSTNKILADAPANTKYFIATVNDAGITPSTAKYCTVTINGKYQTGLETQGRNLINPSDTQDTSYSGLSMTNNNDGSFYFSGTNTYDGGTIFHINLSKVLVSGTEYYLTVNNNKAVSDVSIRLYNNDTYVQNIIEQLDSINESTSFILSEGQTANRLTVRFSQSGTTNGGFTIKPMLSIVSSPQDFQPYHHTTLTIPLTAPLYEGDKICYVKPGDKYVNAEGDTVVADRILYGVYRENATKVLNGTESWYKNNDNANNWLYYTIILGKKEGKVISNYLPYVAIPGDLNIESTDTIGVSSGGVTNKTLLYANFGNAIGENNYKSLKNYLGTNPLTVVYLLATPYFEPFTDQSIFYNLRTDDTLSYVYSSDPIEPNVTVEVAKNSTGGYLLESYAQAQKNAISEANSQSRISAIEQQLVNQATTPTE